MKRNRQTLLAAAMLLGLMTVAPSRAEASMFKFWIEGRGDAFGGTSDLFYQFDYPVGGGLELGIELIEITLFGELITLGLDQFLYTLNLGGDFDFGKQDQARFTIGFYTGPMFFQFPEPDMPQTVSLASHLSDLEQRQLVCATVCSGNCGPDLTCYDPSVGIHTVEQDFNRISQQEEPLGNMAVGWNMVRLRLAVDYPIASVFYLGLAAQAGYHIIISGEEVAAGARNQVVNSYAATYGLNPALTEKLRQAVGAEPVDTSALDGFNFGIHIYFRFELSSRSGSSSSDDPLGPEFDGAVYRHPNGLESARTTPSQDNAELPNRY